ncbi:peptidase M1, membrane alanine aminopeptidase [Acidisarcina polymorpha]|uniref:Peptidase M1, membrane alanine aminopeptidase n=1 Tax=Acidisarcina polymorpha TaxID=2211140 RepID=A0A2Z5G6U3_9BACT|nr:M1 family aminopeptidase [Acidisarcina polymorpha]AXC14993.1 peptidase M1, membrane alanine aminopeptidase [Acidisarcina polymorpha]
MKICGVRLLKKNNPPVAILAALMAVVFLGASPLRAAEKPTINITAYTIDAQLDPDAHSLKATARVTFTSLEPLDTVAFQLHGALKVNKVTDSANHVLSGERGTDATIRLTLPAALSKGQTTTFTFDYEGVLSGSEESPVEGLKLASIGSPISYLFYPARWFPMTGYLTDRFTADIHISVPEGYRVAGSGAVTPITQSGGTFEFRWDKPGFPGTIIAGKFNPIAAPSASYVHIWTTDARKSTAPEFADTAAKEFNFFTGIFGPAESVHFNVVEIPDDTLPAYWAPEIAAIPGSRMSSKGNFRLLANTVSRQWWGSQVSPATLNDAWITNGMSRYAELMYLEEEGGQSALQKAVVDVSAGALAYDTIPLSGIGRDDAFSPEFQSSTLEKGALVFHMLRWEVGDDSFRNILKATLTQFADKPIRTSDFMKLAESQSQQQLTAFFAQWIDGTGAPEFTDKYTVYRLGNNKGFRTIGEIGQDLDLFRMPVELKIETDGKTETRRIDVVGTDSQYVVDTFGRPRHISLDPNNWLLKNSPDMTVRIAILRGQQLIAQGDTTGAIGEYQKALTANPNSSLASYRIGEALFNQRNYQASANAYRDALRGDDDPKWTEVWSHIQLGKIFDVTGQRDRAVNEYREAVQTNDNTQGALNEARQYLQAPYKREESND